ncbi:MAG TPA: hypothetical protein VGU63_12835 [Candidatus Acidoferrales bacterium]|nr:hypothetical protein [Candidatus Acidoferrales bacterium]
MSYNRHRGGVKLTVYRTPEAAEHPAGKREHHHAFDDDFENEI